MNVRYSLAIAAVALLTCTSLWAQYPRPYVPHHRETAPARYWFTGSYLKRIHTGHVGFGATNGCDGKPICSLPDYSKPRHCGCDPHREGILEALLGGGHCFKRKLHRGGCGSCEVPACDCAPQVACDCAPPIAPACGCDAMGCGGCRTKRCTPIKDVLARLFSCKASCGSGCDSGCDMPCGCEAPMLYQRALPLPQKKPSKPSPFKDDPLLEPANPTKPEPESALRSWSTEGTQTTSRYTPKSVWRKQASPRLGTPPAAPTSSLPKYIKQTSFTQPVAEELHEAEGTEPAQAVVAPTKFDGLDVYKVLDAEAKRRDKAAEPKSPVRLLPINSLR